MVYGGRSKPVHRRRSSQAKNVSASDIYSQIVEVTGEEAMRRQHALKWCHSFQSGRQDVENRNMAESGRGQVLQRQKLQWHELKK
ncbi:hypothetical protein TNCV_530171 [Trichonephila clavipes]|nr:hypothetical protein TNCV_530171 [Trichonephila clavipes]